ncbi:ATP synthase F1 subunit delta [Bacteroidota bacterium]
MSDYRIAIRYAKSLLGLAEERGKLEEIKADFESLRGLCNSNRDFVYFLRNPIIPNLKKWAILKKIFEGKLNDESMIFLEIVTRKGRESILPEISKAFIDLYMDLKGIVQAHVTTAIPMDESLKGEFKEILKDIVGKDKKVDLDENIDGSIIGGYKLTVGDKLLDSSISSGLRNLRHKLVI